MSGEQKKQVINVIKKYLEDVENAVDESESEKVSNIPELVQGIDEQQNQNLKNILVNIKELLNSVGKSSIGGRRSSKKRGTQRKQKRRQRRGSRRAY